MPDELDDNAVPDDAPGGEPRPPRTADHPALFVATLFVLRASLLTSGRWIGQIAR